MLAAGQTVTCAWLPMYCSDGRYYIPSCDFSIMVSTEMFREFFLPELLAEIAWLDRTVYHLDGPGALRHLDTLLDIGQLDAIQFVYGDGAKPASRWMHVFKRIQAGGKNLHITIETARGRHLYGEPAAGGRDAADGSVVGRRSRCRAAEARPLEVATGAHGKTGT